MFSSEPTPCEMSTLETKTLLEDDEDMSILGIYLRNSDEPVLIAIETFDNQIDFNELIMNDFEGDFTYSLKQLQEIVPRVRFT
jgi:hypothetical protein